MSYNTFSSSIFHPTADRISAGLFIEATNGHFDKIIRKNWAKAIDA